MTEQLELHYELAELPSAQHRAGLAGLVLLVDYLQGEPWFEERQDRYGAAIELEAEDYAATLRCNLEGLIALFDLAYAAQPEERFSDTKLKKFDRTEEVEVPDRKGQTKTIYLIPKAAFLPELDPSYENGSGVWIKLWREMLWQIVRGVPATRNPYRNRSTPRDRPDETIRFSSDTEKIWQGLTRPDKSVNQSGNYYLGAMAKTAENLPTHDRARYQFLLHFWPFVTQVYCPAVLDKDGKREFRGYALAIPDVANLSEFCYLFRSILREDRAVERYGYRPREAVIDLPEEGGLDVLRLLRDRLQHESGNLQWHDYLLGVELIHAEKVGNSGVKLRSTGYVEPIQTQVDRYSQIRKDYWCPWFRKQRLINLLGLTKPWSGFDALLSQIPRAWLHDPYFSHDARTLLQKEIDMTTQSTSDTREKIRSYAEIIYQVCQAYVLSKLDAKYGLKWKDCAGIPELESDFNTKKEKIVNEAFLAVRARTEQQAFIDYFVSTLYPHIRQSEFAEFATDLFDKTDEIRALTLLSLSSQYPLKPKEALKDGAATSS